MTPQYIKDFVPQYEKDRLFQEMLSINWEKRDDAPRYEYWSNDFNRSYTYGRGAGQRTYEAKLYPIPVLLIRALIAEKLFVHYEGCFCNMYHGKKDWLGWHADDDPGIDHSKPICVVTLGHEREIQWMPQGDKTKISGQMLEHGSLFVMPAGMQQTHFHRIPKVGHEVKTRVSLTYRSLK